MKPKINYYLLRVIKENSIYLIIFVVMLVGAVAGILIFINQFGLINNKIGTTNKEITELKKKADLVTYKQEIIKQGINLDQTNRMLTKLIPNEEDFFSAIYALEELSKKTNFSIVNYTINLKATTKNSLGLTIEGHGDNDTFFNFLRDYRFSGGRLITVDKIDFKFSGFSKIKLNINFYSGKDAAGQNSSQVKLTDFDKRIIKEIQSKVTLDVAGAEENTSFPTKTNPF